MRTTLTLQALRHLIDAGAVRGARLVGQAGGWTCEVVMGMSTRPVGTERADVARVWPSLDRLVAWLRTELGITRLEVDSGAWAPTMTPARPRPDVSARLRGLAAGRQALQGADRAKRANKSTKS